jgi:peroxiredoxin
VVCREQAAELRPHIEAFRRRGAELFIVGLGTPELARGFARETQLEGVTVFCDPSLRAYQLAGFRRGLATVLSPRAAWSYVRAYARGHRQVGTQGDVLQQGGVLVVRPDGTIPYRFASRASGDHPSPDALLEAAGAVGAARPPLP